MRIPSLEAMRRLQREYQRSHPRRLSAGGLYFPHSYADMTPESLSSWDDVGLIWNKRRVIVWWQHPRHVYYEALWDEVYKVVGDGPSDSWLTEGGTKNYKRVGRSRKKLVSTTLREPSPDKRAYYDLLKTTFESISSVGIEHTVPVNWKPRRLRWAMGVNIIAPLEVRNETDLAELASLAKRLIKGQTDLSCLSLLQPRLAPRARSAIRKNDLGA
uniref:Uncharacterized protein n=1 Tax=Curvibacter symbiont subsp. Hydra magnipapillata TaxID=667019 RepID=C9Y933_CURXX|nr:hypothetical protein Csp_A06340 [Curvibacter putative symbiont of Hydra magnipapillata]